MAPWYTGGHSFHGSHGNQSARGSTSGSVPPSPALAPSFGTQSHHSSSLALSSGAQTPAHDEPLDPLDPLFNDQPTSQAMDRSASSSGAATPFSSAPVTPYPTATSSSTGYYPQSGSQYIPLEIILDNDQLVLRGAGGDSNPAYLSGIVVLTLTESTNIKELTLELRGKAKVQFNEGSGAGARSHHHTHLVLTHDWSFLEGHKRHSHTLKAGRHVFPFNLMLDGSLPSSIRTYTSDAYISYKLRAHAIRSTFASNFTAHKTFTLLRTYTTEALEFNQTLEIENTWPGKVMYCLTLPHKAFAAGDEIPVSIKFMPLAKGVRVVSVSSIIKEYSLVHTRHSQHPDARVAASAKHEIRRGRAYPVSTDIDRPPKTLDENQSRPGSAANSAPTSPTRQPLALPPTANAARDSSQHRTPGPRRPADSYFPSMAGGSAQPEASGSNPDAAASTASLVTRESGTSSVTTDIELGDDEVDTHITIPIPTWTTPSHNVHPVFVSHKIKWSCSISNADGHVSELRCALPILIIAHPLLAEAHAAGAQTRALLFGGAAAAEAQQVDLPSYNNHVYDRVASLEPGMSTAAFTTRSVHQTPMPSPSEGTPPHSRPPSRPGSPVRGEYAGDVPPRPQLSSWADSELLLSLGALGRDGSNPASNDNSPTATPPDSRTPSRPGSRSGFRGRNSNPSSRAGSRASSPERRPGGEDDIIRPEPLRRQSHGLHGLFHMPAIKPMKAFTAIGGGKPVHGRGDASPTFPQNQGSLQRSSQSFTNVQQANHPLPGRSNLAASSHFNSRSSGDLYSQRFSNSGAGPSALRPSGSSPSETANHPEVDPLSQVPSYAIASRGFLGGGVTPLNSGLPTYDEAEGHRGSAVARTRSEGDLTALIAGPQDEQGHT